MAAARTARADRRTAGDVVERPRPSRAAGVGQRLRLVALRARRPGVAGLASGRYLGWLILWGPLAAIALPRLPLLWLAALAIGFDLLYMPRAEPLLTLGDGWLGGEALGVLACLLPAQLLARWTAADRQLKARVALQVIGFTGLLVGVIPTVALQQAGGEWRPLSSVRLWQLSLIAQGLALPAIVGLAAVRNLLDGQRLAAAVRSAPPPGHQRPLRLPREPDASRGVRAACRAGGHAGQWLASGRRGARPGLRRRLASWHENTHMRVRFGADWLAYRRGVHVWRPRWRPYVAPHSRPDELYVDLRCGPCAQLGRWLQRRQPRGLRIVSAADYPSRELDRLTFRSADHTCEEQGVAALARALEHIHLGWAVIGWTLRLPVVCQVVQLLVDASGGGPRTVSRRPRF